MSALRQTDTIYRSGRCGQTATLGAPRTLPTATCWSKVIDLIAMRPGPRAWSGGLPHPLVYAGNREPRIVEVEAEQGAGDGYLELPLTVEGHL